MFLKKDKRPNGRLYLSIVKGYRDPITKKNKQKAIRSIGFYDELINEYDDPIAHFTKVAKQMTDDETSGIKQRITIDTNETMPVGTDDMKNIGFIILSKLYHELGIHTFLINRERGLKAKFPLNSIMKLLVFDRILHPSSKLSSYDNRHRYLESFDFPLESLYRALRIFSKHKDKLLLSIHETISMRYGRDTTRTFYDVTNYYFHIDHETELVAKGMSKDKKGKPIIQMGLLLDNLGLPMTYKLFRGNTNDFDTLLPILAEVKNTFGLKRTVVVADKGLNSSTNKAYNIIQGDGYIFSRSLRGTKADQDVKNYALDDSDYTWGADDYKFKSRVYPTTITVENDQGKRVKVDIDEKHIVFYSEKYKKRARHKRNEAIAKAEKLICSKARYAKAENYGALKYIKGMKLDKKTGELTPAMQDVQPIINYDLIREEEKFDGYYSIVTSELDMIDHQVIDTYRGLWKIEESFKITKTSLKARPVYLRHNDAIEAHFLTCFISLLVLRLLEIKTQQTFSTQKLISSLTKANVCHLQTNTYKALYYDDVLKTIDLAIGTDLSKKYLTLAQIKKLIADTK